MTQLGTTGLSSQEKRALLMKLMEQRERAVEILPLSPAQERLWFVDRLAPGTPAYNIPAIFRLPRGMRIELLEPCLAQLVQRHESLRTVFGTEDGVPVQFVWAERPIPVARVDLRALSSVERTSALAALCSQEASRGFDLTSGPLLRVTLVDLGHDGFALVLVLHHIIADAWSLQVFIDELKLLYENRVAPSARSLPAPAHQYRDYVAWQRRCLTGAAVRELLDAWRGYLDGAPPAIDLPTDRIRPPVLGVAADQVAFRLAPEPSARLRALSQELRVTPFMVLLSAFGVLLARYSGQTDLVLGTPVSHRTRPEFEKLIGFLVNTLVLRLDLSDGPTFHELVGRVRQSMLWAYEHQDLPFERLVQELQPVRQPNRNPLFQIMFAFQNAAPALQQALASVRPDDTTQGLPAPPVFAKFDLTVNVSVLDDAVVGNFEFSTQLFTRPTMARLCAHFVRLLEELALDANRAVDRIPLLSTSERSVVLEQWNATDVSLPEEPICAQIERQAALTPERVAVISDNAELTYAELMRRSHGVARLLIDLDIRQGTVVGVCFERSADLVVALLGVMRAGAAYLPLSIEDPALRMARMVAECGAALVLHERATAACLREVQVDTIELDGAYRELLAEQPETALERDVDPDAPAYVIGTSGSSGHPKGVVIPQRALSNHMAWMADRWPLTADDVVALKTPHTFDASVWEFWAPLMQGARLAVAREGGHKDPSYLVDFLVRQRVTILQIVPTMLRVLLEIPEFGCCVALRHVFAGGEALSADLRDRVFEVTRAQLHNLYGPTEATIDATSHTCSRDDREPVVPIGRPIANTRAYVLDRWGEPVPIGVVGELFIAGRGVAREYAGQPDLTARSFLRDPFGRPGERMYRTGDLARFRADGALEYRGRADQQVKLRGVRVELGEIEAVLREHAAVRDAAALVDGGTLRAYLVMTRDDLEGVRAHARDWLPSALVPSEFIVLEQLPLTASGKLDRRALASAQGSRVREIGPTVAPRTATEAVLVSFLTEILGRESVGVETDLFELGLHSLLIAQLAARVRSVLGVELQLQAVFQRPTIAALAQVLQARAHHVDALCAALLQVSSLERGESERLAASAGTTPPSVDRAPALARPVPIRFDAPARTLVERILREQGVRFHLDPSIRPRRPDESIPLSYAQERLWFLDKLDEGSAAYNVPGYYRLPSDVRLDALERALASVVERHEILRTSFPIEGGRPVQRVHAPGRAPKLELLDLRHVADDQVQARTQAHLQASARERFDLEHGPLLRASAVLRPRGEHILVMTLHHIISDAASAELLLKELSSTYEALARYQTPSLPALPVQYGDYAIWLRHVDNQTEFKRQLEYWRKQLEGAPALLALPHDRPRPRYQTTHGELESFVVPPELAGRLRELARARGVTLFMLTFAGFAAWLSRLTGQHDLMIGTPVSTRNRPELEPLIGLFLNTLVLRVDTGGDPTFEELLQRVRQCALGAFEHQELPFERLVDELSPERNLAVSPLFQVLFTLIRGGEPGGRRDESAPFGTGTAKFELSLVLVDTGESLEATWEYNSDLFERDSVRRFSRRLLALLDALAADAGECVRRLPVMDRAEKTLVLDRFNEFDAGYPHVAMHELFEAQAARTPGACALYHDDQALDFASLDEEANRLAHVLIAHGVAPGTAVCVCMERSLEVFVALLAILKAGGVWVPLSADYPVDRVAFMLEDIGCAHVLTLSRLRDRIPTGEHWLLCVDSQECAELTASAPASKPDVHVGIDDALYVIYTSGSTGLPKGVRLSHRVLVNLVWWQLGRSKRVDGPTAAVSSLVFDVSLQEIFSTWCAGQTLMVPTERVRRDPQLLLEFLAERRVQRIFLPFVALRQLVDVSTDGTVPRALRQVITAGDQLHVTDAVRRFFSQVPECELCNQYGPSETHIVSDFSLSGPNAAWPQFPPLGRPVSNCKFYVLDSDRELAPVGVTGELFIAGDCVAEGYVERPELTAERFQTNPFHASAPRMYASGDLARWLPSGDVEFLGRRDHQVKIQGFRVELGEVEAALIQLEAVAEAVVLARRAGSDDKQLVAYVVSSAGHELDWSAIGAQLARVLPGYMVPSAYVSLERVPLTSSGKVDRIRLEALEVDRASPRTDYVAPQGELEATLAALFVELLGVPRAGSNDNFFQLGGHSLLATQLVSRIRDQFQVELPLRRFFEQPTVSGVALILQELLRAGGGEDPDLDSLAAQLQELPDRELEALLRAEAT